MRLKGPFEAYNQFKDVPRALRAAPDAKTWAGVQLWLWWLPPTSFSGDGDRVVCKSRQLTVWPTMLCGLRTEESITSTSLPEELWLYTFGFLKHDQQPTFPNKGFGSEDDAPPAPSSPATPRGRARGRLRGRFTLKHDQQPTFVAQDSSRCKCVRIWTSSTTLRDPASKFAHHPSYM